MNRPKNPRIRLVKTRAAGEDTQRGDRPPSQLVGATLGYRVVITEQAEVWTVRGVREDGSVTEDDIGELSFVLIPGTQEPAAAITGFVAPPPGTWDVTEEVFLNQLRNMVVMLGYDREGFYASVGVGGHHVYYEEFEDVEETP